MGISRDSWHKRRATGGRMKQLRKKRKYELGRPPAMTKLGGKRVHPVRTRGGNTKFRALRLDSGNFSWGTESITRKTRIVNVVYNASNNELVRTNTLVKGGIVEIDAAPFKQWYQQFYGVALGKKGHIEEEDKKASRAVALKKRNRAKNAEIDPLLVAQFDSGRLYAAISSRPGQSGRADGYILEGAELQFYERQLRKKK